MTAKQRLEATLWDIANTLRGKMSADRACELRSLFHSRTKHAMKIFRLSLAALVVTSLSASAQDPIQTCARGTKVTCVVNEGGKGKVCTCKQLMIPGSNGGYNVRQVEFVLPKFGHDHQADVVIENTSKAKHRFVLHDIRFNSPKDGTETQVTIVAVHHKQKSRRDDKVDCTLEMHIDQ